MTSGFAPGSRLMLSSTTATSFAPLKSLPNNTYYWRVRGVDPQRQAGPWNNGPAFDKTFDGRCCPGPPTCASATRISSRGERRSTSTSPWPRGAPCRARAVRGPGALRGRQHEAVYSTTNTAWTPLAEHGTGIPALFNSANSASRRRLPAGGRPLRRAGARLRRQRRRRIGHHGDSPEHDDSSYGGQTITEPLVDCDDPAPFPDLGRLDYDASARADDHRQEPAALLEPRGHEHRPGQPGRQRRQHGLLGGDRT